MESAYWTEERRLYKFVFVRGAGKHSRPVCTMSGSRELRRSISNLTIQKFPQSLGLALGGKSKVEQQPLL